MPRSQTHNTQIMHVPPPIKWKHGNAQLLILAFLLAIMSKTQSETINLTNIITQLRTKKWLPEDKEAGGSMRKVPFYGLADALCFVTWPHISQSWLVCFNTCFRHRLHRSILITSTLWHSVELHLKGNTFFIISSWLLLKDVVFFQFCA